MAGAATRFSSHKAETPSGASERHALADEAVRATQSTQHMDTQILSTSARILDRNGYETHRAEVALYTDNGNKYIRVGSTLLWRNDVLEIENRLECLASGMIILL